MALSILAALRIELRLRVALIAGRAARLPRPSAHWVRVRVRVRARVRVGVGVRIRVRVRVRVRVGVSVRVRVRVWVRGGLGFHGLLEQWP
jgi:hypothetical protein